MHCISSSIIKGIILPSDSFPESVFNHFLNLLGLMGEQLLSQLKTLKKYPKENKMEDTRYCLH